jgi:hypothetical protein
MFDLLLLPNEQNRLHLSSLSPICPNDTILMQRVGENNENIHLINT